jgi:CHAT domain-containing protein/tetratricopeptide (TPR) repeat protein
MIQSWPRCLLFLLFLVGCVPSSGPSFEQVYTTVQSKFDTGDLPEALNLANAGLSQSGSRDPAWNWKFRVLAAEIDLWQGNPDDALKLLESDPPPALSPKTTVRRKLIQCRASYTKNNLEAAQSFLAEAEPIVHSGAPELQGELELARGSILIKEGRYPKARQSLQLALNFAEEHHDGLLQAKVLGTIGYIYTSEASYDDGQDKLLSGLALSQSLRARHIESGMLLNTGWNLLELGDLDQAEPLFKESARLAALAGQISLEHSALNSLGRLHINLGDYEAARGYFSRALDIARPTGESRYIGEYLNNLSSANLELGRLEEAEKNNQEALDIFKRTGNHSLELRALLNKVSIATSEGKLDNSESQLQAIIHDPDVTDSLRWEVQDELARYYIAKHQDALARNQFQQVLNTLDHAREPIRDAQNRLAFSFWEAAFHTHYIHFLIEQGDPKGALRVAESMQARDLEEGLSGASWRQTPLQIATVQSYLRKHSQVIFDYWLAPTESFLWVVTPSEMKLFRLPAKREIEEKVDRYQNAITDLEDVEVSGQGGQDLYRTLVEPASDLIPTGFRVVVIPDGGLGKLNFETLLVPGRTGHPQHFWIRDVEIENASSIALLIKPRSFALAGKKLLLMGAPEQAHRDYPVLTYAGNEMEKISTHFSPAEKLIIAGKDATPEAYDRVKPGQFEVIDFVTHGVASETQPLDSAIILSAQPNKAFKLYARNIINRRLNARIVIVSACYGAGKRSYSASGLVGLAWAFLRAGAHQVIAGSWKVDDRSTPQFMDDFYTAWKSGQSASSALRCAKLKMLNSGTAYRLPNFWAALQLYTGA